MTTSGLLNLKSGDALVSDISDLTATAAELNKVDGLGATTYPVVQELRTFTEAGGTTYTGTVEIPAGSFLLNIQVVTTVLWDDGTSAVFICGDDDDPNGWFESTNIKATALVVGEVLDISNAENWGGEEGAYLVAASGRKGRVTAGVDSGIYYGAASEVIGVCTTGAQNGTAGRTFMVVTYCTPTAVAATSA